MMLKENGPITGSKGKRGKKKKKEVGGGSPNVNKNNEKIEGSAERGVF